MKPLLLVALLTLAACSPAAQQRIDAALATPAGALFCAIQTAAGPLVVTLINAELTGVAPVAAPVAILATGASKAFVDAACAKAGGIAVAPPVAGVVPQVAVKV